MRKLSKYIGLFMLLASAGFATESQEYKSENEFQVRNGEVQISGTLFYPEKAAQKVPVLIFIPGSAAETREAFLPYVKPITDSGCAVVIYDKRGTGKSTGDFIKISSKTSERLINERANDVLAIIKYLKSQERVDASKIGASASSQGTWVAHAIQRKSKSLGFLMCTSGGVASVGESDFYDEILDDEAVTIEEGNKQLSTFSGYHGFDPKPDLKDVDIPVVFIYGAMDRSHPILYDISVLKEMNKPNFEVHLLPNVNHDLIDISTGQFSNEVGNKAFEWMASIFR